MKLYFRNSRKTETENTLTELMSPYSCIDSVALQFIAGANGIDHVLGFGIEVEGPPWPGSTVMADSIDDVVVAVDA